MVEKFDILMKKLKVATIMFAVITVAAISALWWMAGRNPFEVIGLIAVSYGLGTLLAFVITKATDAWVKKFPPKSSEWE